MLASVFLLTLRNIEDTQGEATILATVVPYICYCSIMQGFGWAIAKALAEAGAEISLGVWVRQTVNGLKR